MYEANGIGREEMKLKLPQGDGGMRSKAARPTKFGVCTNNRGYPASLEVGKLYPVIPDAEAAKHGYLRVIDESGEDYGYSAQRFFVLEIPDALAKVLQARTDSRVSQPSQSMRPGRTSQRLNARVSWARSSR